MHPDRLRPGCGVGVGGMMARFRPRTELYLRSDIENVLQMLALVAQEMTPGDYQRGFLNALGYVAVGFDLGVVCANEQSALPLYSWAEAK